MAAFKNCFYKDASFRAPHLDQTDFESSVIPATDHHFTIRNTRQKMYLNAKIKSTNRSVVNWNFK